MIEQVAMVSYVLAFYLVASHIFFLVVINKLVNKLMSRNYYEYQQTPSKPKPPNTVVEDFAQDHIGRVFS